MEGGDIFKFAPRGAGGDSPLGQEAGVTLDSISPLPLRGRGVGEGEPLGPVKQLLHVDDHRRRNRRVVRNVISLGEQSADDMNAGIQLDTLTGGAVTHV